MVVDGIAAQQSRERLKMGHHYTPQKYLRGFCVQDASGMIWMYDKKQKRLRLAAIDKVAQEKGFYTEDDERNLNLHVECPANTILDRLRNGGSLIAADREVLGAYIATFIYRVPHNREHSLTFVPQALEDTVQHAKALLFKAQESGEVAHELISTKLAEVDEYAEKHRKELPPEIQQEIDSPWPHASVVEAIQDMNWLLLTTSGPSFFMTSDNPVFLFQKDGVGNLESEISFPISSALLLHCSHQRVRFGQRVEVTQQCVREMNRRTASRASRFLFYHEDREWVAKLGDTPANGHFLSRIRW